MAMNRTRTRGRRRTYALGSALALASALVLVLAVHQVDNSLTLADERAIPVYLQGVDPLQAERNFARELAFIRDVQDAVLDAAPGNEPLPDGTPREPGELLAAKTGLCFDRSRVIEKILRYSGLNTRHVAIYSTEGSSAPRAILTPGVSSHAVTEVLTERGWLVVDSNDRWVSIDASGDPVPIERIRDAAGSEAAPIAWQQPPPTPIYLEPFTLVYGLYSRHGRFYPPYNAIPDVNYAELIHNLRP